MKDCKNYIVDNECDSIDNAMLHIENDMLHDMLTRIENDIFNDLMQACNVASKEEMIEKVAAVKATKNCNAQKEQHKKCALFNVAFNDALRNVRKTLRDDVHNSSYFDDELDDAIDDEFDAELLMNAALIKAALASFVREIERIKCATKNEISTNEYYRNLARVDARTIYNLALRVLSEKTVRDKNSMCASKRLNAISNALTCYSQNNECYTFISLLYHHLKIMLSTRYNRVDMNYDTLHF